MSDPARKYYGLRVDDAGVEYRRNCETRWLDGYTVAPGYDWVVVFDPDTDHAVERVFYRVNGGDAWDLGAVKLAPPGSGWIVDEVRSDRKQNRLVYWRPAVIAGQVIENDPALVRIKVKRKRLAKAWG